jgi:hypothetical protein
MGVFSEMLASENQNNPRRLISIPLVISVQIYDSKSRFQIQTNRWLSIQVT